MTIRTEWVSFADRVGYLAWPEKAALPLPGVVVIQEIWGVEGHIQDVTRRIAAAGYAALAPDLYSEHGERPEALTAERLAETQRFMNEGGSAVWTDPAARQEALSKRPDAERERITQTYAAVFSAIGPGGAGIARFVPALLAASKFLRHECDASRGRRTGCVGFCMGGGLSALLACEDPELSGAAIFYGSSPPIEKVPRIACPVLGLYAGLDQRVNAGVPAFEQAMAAHGKAFDRQTYEGALHGFFHDGRATYHADGARDAFVRLLQHFRRTLV
jgi:carboxymethylenebutenolidase